MPSCSPPLVSRLAAPVRRASRPFLFETGGQSLPDLVDIQAARKQALLGRVAQDEADGRLKRRAPDPISLAVGGRAGGGRARGIRYRSRSAACGAAVLACRKRRTSSRIRSGRLCANALRTA